MKCEVKDKIQTEIAENIQDVAKIMSDIEFLLKTGCLEGILITRNAETSDYVDAHIKFKPNQNWIK